MASPVLRRQLTERLKRVTFVDEATVKRAKNLNVLVLLVLY